MTLLDQLRKGETPDLLTRAAAAEHIDAAALAQAVRAGRAVIPANTVHAKGSLRPMAIGRIASIKINANLGASPVKSSIEDERKKLQLAVAAGADTVMDLSTCGNLDAVREMFVAESPVPVGTVPIYEAIQHHDVAELSIDAMLKVIAKQAQQGIDFFTIHAGLLKEHVPLTAGRIAGIFSRGGAILAKWMLYHNRQNPLYEHFDEIIAILREYDVGFSLGDGMRPGALADAGARAQLAEQHTLAELSERAQAAGCQVMIEGPGHVPLDQIEYQMKLQQQMCKGAPFYVLGPLVSDIGAGYDHITAAIGATLAGLHGASFLCYVTPTEHLSLPDNAAVREGVMAFRLAAHAADVARGFPGARDRDDQMSHARAALNWPEQYRLALDSTRARALRERDHCPGEDYCTMCGEKWCAMRTNLQIREMLAGGKKV